MNARIRNITEKKDKERIDLSKPRTCKKDSIEIIINKKTKSIQNAKEIINKKINQHYK